MRGKPLIAAGASTIALAVAAVLLGGAVAVPGTPTAAPAPPVAAAGALGAALPAAAPPSSAPSRPPPTTAAPTAAAVPPPSAHQRTAAAQSAGTVRLRGGGEARLVREELGPDATLPVPESLREATWWGADLAATEGATVLAGHVNWRGRTGPFAELWDARTGDRVSVVDPAGTTWTYAVSEVVTVPKDDLPARAEALFGQSGPHRLVLVTCGGRWVGGSDGYESNRIVIALPT